MGVNQEKSILLVSSGQPSLNPRLVKEADALSRANYKVTVLYAYWNEWGARHDKELLPTKKWKAICVAGDPQHHRIAWFLSRLIHKAARQRLEKTGNFKKHADRAVARSSYFLTKAAKKHYADLYIAHNLGALPAAATAAAIHGKPYGFDAEDFHRQEINDDTGSLHYKLCTYLEDKYLPSAAYLTASSPLITQQYVDLYRREVTTLLNVFPTVSSAPPSAYETRPLKLFWFSQTIGPNRGLELIIEAVGLCKANTELHLLGQPSGDYLQHLFNFAKTAGLDERCIYFYPPVKGDEIFKMAAQFDIGLASETGFCLNNNLALSNKIFTYIQSGLAVAASNTPAQSGLLEKYPKAGKIYSNAQELAAILNFYNDNREQLYQTKKDAFRIGQTELNWDMESKKFMGVIEKLYCSEK